MLAIAPTGVVPSFVKTSNILSPFGLYENVTPTEVHGLVCVQFLAVLNVHLGGEKYILKNAMNEFFHNLSIQALNQLVDRIEIQFDAINKLIKSINNLLITEAHKFRKQPEENLFGNFADYKTKNQKFEDDVVRNFLYEFRVQYLQDTDHLTFPNTTKEIKKQAAEELEQKNKLKLARNERDHEIMKGIVLNAKKDLIITLAGLDGDVSSEVSNLAGFNIDELETSNYNLKNRFEQTTNKLLEENNADIVSKMLVEDVINKSIEGLEVEQKKFAVNYTNY